MTSVNTPEAAVSIIVVSYNSAAHLPRCCKHLAVQTFREIEKGLAQERGVRGENQAIIIDVKKKIWNKL